MRFVNSENRTVTGFTLAYTYFCFEGDHTTTKKVIIFERNYFATSAGNLNTYFIFNNLKLIKVD